LTLLVRSFDPYSTVPDMTCYVLGGTLNCTQSVRIYKNRRKSLRLT